MQDAILYNMLPEPTDDENDMLDLAYGLTETCALPHAVNCSSGACSAGTTGCLEEDNAAVLGCAQH